MSERIELKDVAEKLLEQDDILIICHKNPDGDTLGAGFALMHALNSLGKTAEVLCSDVIHERYQYMLPKLFSGSFSPKFIVTVDVAGQQLLGELAAPYAKRIDLAIDHHPSNTGFAEELWLIDDAAATCEMIFDLLEYLEIIFNQVMADCLYTGISTDTGCFKFENTSPNTHRVAARLMEYGANYKMLNNLLFESKSRRRIEIEKQALASLRYHFYEKVASITITKEQIERLEVDETDLEGITAVPRMSEGVDVGITLRQLKEGAYKVSVRTTPAADASAICARLGGGGHKRAAGCEIIGSSENVMDAVLKEVSRELGYTEYAGS